jgi:hypothetical protein
MHVKINIDGDERKSIKDWADKQEIRLPKAYTMLIRAGMKAENINPASKTA